MGRHVAGEEPRDRLKAACPEPRGVAKRRAQPGASIFIEVKPAKHPKRSCGCSCKVGASACLTNARNAPIADVGRQ